MSYTNSVQRMYRGQRSQLRSLIRLKPLSHQSNDLKTCLCVCICVYVCIAYSFLIRQSIKLKLLQRIRVCEEP